MHIPFIPAALLISFALSVNGLAQESQVRPLWSSADTDNEKRLTEFTDIVGTDSVAVYGLRIPAPGFPQQMLVAVDRATCQTLWSVVLTNQLGSGDLERIASNGTVAMLGTGASLSFRNLSDGALQSAFTLPNAAGYQPGGLSYAPLLDRVFASYRQKFSGSGNGTRIVRVVPSSGQVDRQIDLPVPTSDAHLDSRLLLAPSSQTIYLLRTLQLGTSSFEVQIAAIPFSLSAVTWSTSLPIPNQAEGIRDAQLSGDGNTLYLRLGPPDGPPTTLSAVALQSGQVLWTAAIPGLVAIAALDADVLALGRQDGRWVSTRLSAATGQAVWSTPLGVAGEVLAKGSLGRWGSLAVSGGDGYAWFNSRALASAKSFPELVRLDLTSGALLERIPLDLPSPAQRPGKLEVVGTPANALFLSWGEINAPGIKGQVVERVQLSPGYPKLTSAPLWQAAGTEEFDDVITDPRFVTAMSAHAERILAQFVGLDQCCAGFCTLALSYSEQVQRDTSLVEPEWTKGVPQVCSNYVKQKSYPGQALSRSGTWRTTWQGGSVSLSTPALVAFQGEFDSGPVGVSAGFVVSNPTAAYNDAEDKAFLSKNGIWPSLLNTPGLEMVALDGSGAGWQVQAAGLSSQDLKWAAGRAAWLLADTATPATGFEVRWYDETTGTLLHGEVLVPGSPLFSGAGNLPRTLAIDQETADAWLLYKVQDAATPWRLGQFQAAGSGTATEWPLNQFLPADFTPYVAPLAGPLPGQLTFFGLRDGGGCRRAALYSLDTTSGNLLWSHEVPGCEAPLRLGLARSIEGTTLIGFWDRNGQDRRIEIFDNTSGVRLERYDFPPDPPAALPIPQPLVVPLVASRGALWLGDSKQVAGGDARLFAIETALASATSISISQPKTLHLHYDGPIEGAGNLYFLAGSSSGTFPGLLLNQIDIPLNYDAYSLATFVLANKAPFLETLSLLDRDGDARSRLEVPAGLPTALAGLTLHHAFLRFDENLALVDSSRALPLLFIP